MTDAEILQSTPGRPLESAQDHLDTGLEVFEDGDVDGLRAAAVAAQEELASLAGFEPLEAEIEGADVKCAGCEQVAPIDEMGVTADLKTSTDDEVVLSYQRFYLHNDAECMKRFTEKQA